MTIQVPDTIDLDGTRHDLAGIDGHGLWRPADAGLPVVMASTACWRGYVCAYAVESGRLLLEGIEAMVGRFGDDDDFVAIEAPPLNGSPPIPLSRGNGEMFNTRYRQLSLAVAFDGVLIAGGDRVSDAGAVQVVPWEYGRVLHLRFLAGELVETIDLSVAMDEIRSSLAVGDSDGARQRLERAGLAWLISHVPS
jgi:hypothetical protein